MFKFQFGFSGESMEHTAMRIMTGIIGAAISALAFPALAESPSRSLLYNKKETGSLSYDCLQNGVYLDCDFVQVSVKRKSNPSDFAKSQQKDRESYPAIKKEMEVDSSKMCGQAEEFASVFHGGKSSKGDWQNFLKSFSSMTPLQKADLGKVADTMLAFCKSPSEEKFLAFTGASFDIESRTCSVSSNPYKQRFKQVDGSDVWVVVQDSPEGLCGVINISRFELDPAEPKYHFWKYFAKKAVTNKSGVVLPGMGCSDLDENEYEYDWHSKDVQLSCDYISFSAL
jgi:hypothetical protein